MGGDRTSAFTSEVAPMNAHVRNGPAPARRVQLSPDIEKVKIAVGYLIKVADRRGQTLTQYDIVKALFFADKAHLNNFGRPVTFDNYVAMNHGPVPSLAYDMLKRNDVMLRKYGVEALPWQSESAERLGFGCIRFFGSTVEGETEVLSASDIEALEDALSTVKGLTFQQIRDLTHGDPAYKEAWALVGEGKSMAMSLGLLYDVPDFDAAEEVRFISQQKNESLSDSDDLDTYLARFEAGKHS